MSEETRDRKTQAAEGPSPDADEPVLTAEIVSEPLANPPGIWYSNFEIASMMHRYSRLKPIEPGDLCCNCRKDCDREGFSVAEFKAYRINGHPLCARGTCYDTHIAEFCGRRQDCGCGRRKQNERLKHAPMSE
jgi:hypothetical protein